MKTPQQNPVHQVRKTIVIHNPIAGSRKKVNVEALVQQHLKPIFPQVECWPTQYAGHATELAQQAASKGADLIIAAGGDGTINEIGRAILNTEVALAVLPLGSGNGLARHLNIPLQLEDALSKLAHAKEVRVDAAKINEHPYFCTAGVGYDAEVAKTFHQIAQKRGRGLFNYIVAGWIAYQKFRPEVYEVETETEQFRTSAFSLTMANAGQFGNNAIISKDADVSDGLLDMCIVRPFPYLRGIEMTARLFMGKLEETRLFSKKHIKQAVVHRKAEGWMHFDGEPRQMPKELHFSLQPKALKMLLPQN